MSVDLDRARFTPDRRGTVPAVPGARVSLLGESPARVVLSRGGGVLADKSEAGPARATSTWAAPVRDTRATRGSPRLKAASWVRRRPPSTAREAFERLATVLRGGDDEGAREVLLASDATGGRTCGGGQFWGSARTGQCSGYSGGGGGWRCC